MLGERIDAGLRRNDDEEGAGMTTEGVGMAVDGAGMMGNWRLVGQSGHRGGLGGSVVVLRYGGIGNAGGAGSAAARRHFRVGAAFLGTAGRGDGSRARRARHFRVRRHSGGTGAGRGGSRPAEVHGGAGGAGADGIGGPQRAALPVFWGMHRVSVAAYPIRRAAGGEKGHRRGCDAAHWAVSAAAGGGCFALAPAVLLSQPRPL